MGWTWDYLLWGVKWHIVQKMLIDAPNYKYKKSEDESDEGGKKVKTSSLRDLLNKTIQQQQINK